MVMCQHIRIILLHPPIPDTMITLITLFLDRAHTVPGANALFTTTQLTILK